MDFTQAQLGPKMQACTERERKFVWHFLMNGGKDATQAARDAGVNDPGTSTIRVQAFHLVHRERVRAAMKEVAFAAFDGLIIPAVSALGDMIRNEKHPDHMKSVLSFLSRAGFSERSGVDLKVSGQVEHNHTDSALQDLRVLLQMGVPREKLVEAFGFSGLERYERMLAELEAKAPRLIEGDEPLTPGLRKPLPVSAIGFRYEPPTDD